MDSQGPMIPQPHKQEEIHTDTNHSKTAENQRQRKS